MSNDPYIDELVNEGLLPQTTAQAANADLTFGAAEGHWIDGDTIKLEDGSKVRLAGYNTNEIARPAQDKFGQVGGVEQAALVADLARKQGFTNLVDTGRTDPYGRKIMDLTNAAGSSFATELTAEGIINQGRYTTQEAIDASVFENLARQAQGAAGVAGGDFDVAAAWINEALDEQGGDTRGLRAVAFDEQELAAGKKSGLYVDDAVQQRHYDRGYDNKARNPMSTAFRTGLKGVVDGGYGLLELVGHKSGWEGLESWAEGRKDLTQQEIAALPSVIVDYKEIEDTGDFVEYVGNLAALSLPYMALTIGAAAAGGAFLAAPAAVYAGQVWNDMGDTDEEDKSASLAIGAGISMAVLDRLGIKGLTNTSLLSTQGRNEIMEKLIAQGATPAQANGLVVNATQRVAAELSGDAANFARRQLEAGTVVKQLLKNAGRSGAQESLTEVGQEAIGYLAAVAGSSKVFDAEELQNRLTNAAIGGGVLGGTLATPKTAIDTGKWADVAYRLAPADEGLRTRENQWAQEEIDQHGRLLSTAEIAQTAELDANRKRDTYTTITERASDETGRRKKRSLAELRDEYWEAIPGLWRGSVRHIFKPELSDRSVTARKLSALYGGSLSRVYSGASYETARHLKQAEYVNLTRSLPDLVRSFGRTNIRSKTRREISDQIYGAFNLAVDKNGRLDWDKLQGTEYESIIPQLKELAAEAKVLTDKLYDDQKRYNPELKKLSNYAFRHRGIDKKAVIKNTSAFKADLKRLAPDLDQKTIDDITNQIVNNPIANDIDTAFSVLEQGGIQPGSHKQRTLNLSDNADFASKWLNPDFFENLVNMSRSAARYTTYQQYAGDNNKIVSSMLDDMEQELIASGMDKDKAKQETDRVALGLKDYFDAESGNYKQPKTEFGRNLQKFQKNFMFITTLSSLPLATLSSTVELALTTRSLNAGQINELRKRSKREAKELFRNLKSDKDFDSPGRQALRELNYIDWDTGAATVTGATEISFTQQEFTNLYFRSIGLQQFTDFTRALRASIVGDYLYEKVDLIAKTVDPTNESVEANDALRNLGIDVQRFVDLSTKIGPRTAEEQQFIDEQMRHATFNFINDAVVLPTAANRPLFYQDPRFALFTQFHGFISSFQANILPKLYRDAFKGQTPTMKYNAFAVMTSMIMLGFVSQYLKDLMKYQGIPGAPGGVRSSPYLENWEDYIQRGVGASGLMGTGERVFNLFNPIYDSRHQSTADWAFDTITGESAAISKAKQVTDAGGKILSGDFQTGAERAGKFIPWVGPFTGARKSAAEWVFGEDE